MDGTVLAVAYVGRQHCVLSAGGRYKTPVSTYVTIYDGGWFMSPASTELSVLADAFPPSPYTIVLILMCQHKSFLA